MHVWRPRRSSFGELVMMDSSPYRWLEERGPAGHLIALIGRKDLSSAVRSDRVQRQVTTAEAQPVRAVDPTLQRDGRFGGD
jgi:hypothetical protein